MMHIDIFQGMNQWVLWLVSTALLCAAAFAFWRLGTKHSAHDDGRLAAMSGVQGTALGLMTLIISFTFSAALNRYDNRKSLVLIEANAIDTAAQRARFLPAPYPAQFGELLTQYTQVRLSMSDYPEQGLKKIVMPSLALQHMLWDKAVEVSPLDPHSIPNGQFLQALSEMLDLHEKRLAADRNHVPDAVFILLYALATVALGLHGYKSGLSGARVRFPTILLAVLLSSVILEIHDLDRPQRGLITVSQQAMANVGADAADVK
jgi:hypothetical protein